MSNKRLIEAKGKPTASLGDGVFEVRIIESGHGSSGYYSPDLLETYGTALFKAGRPSFANHPTEAEYENGRDITKIMGRLVEDSEWRAEDNALFGKLKVKPEWVDFVEEYKDVIGLSIFASGTVTEGEIDGQKTTIIESFDVDDPYASVDFVVAAGAGGKVERMVESFKAKEALNSDRREQLANLVKDAHGSDNVYVWVRDYDDSTNTVYFDIDGNGEYGIYSQSYNLNNDIAVELAGEQTEVRVQTTYVPLNPATATTAEGADKENGMTPEEIEAVAKAVAEALKPAPADDAEKEVDIAAVAEAMVAADLPESARKRVYEGMKVEGADVAALIEAEKAYVAEIVKESEVEDVPGRLRESGSTTDYTVGGW